MSELDGALSLQRLKTKSNRNIDDNLLMPYTPRHTQEAVAIRRRKTLNYTYYNPDYADAIKVVIDAMLIDGRTRSFSCAKYNKTVSTLERLINRAINFLVDNCDESKTYYNFRRRVMVKKIYRSDENKNSVDIVWKVPQFGGTSESITNDTNKSEEREVTPQSTEWQSEVDTYICSGEVGTELVISDLSLDNEGVLAVKASVAGISEVVLVSVTSQQIVLRKVK